MWKAAAASRSQQNSSGSAIKEVLYLADAQKVHIGRLMRQQQGQGMSASAHAGSAADAVQAPCSHVRAQQYACMQNQTLHPVSSISTLHWYRPAGEKIVLTVVQQEHGHGHTHRASLLP